MATVPVPPPTISAVTVTAVPTTRVRETSVVESKDPARQNYPLAKLQISNWFPPTLTPLTGVSCSRPDILRSLKKSKVVMQKVLTDRNGLAVMWPERYGLARSAHQRIFSFGFFKKVFKGLFGVVRHPSRGHQPRFVHYLRK